MSHTTRAINTHHTTSHTNNITTYKFASAIRCDDLVSIICKLLNNVISNVSCASEHCSDGECRVWVVSIGGVCGQEGLWDLMGV